MALIQFTLSSRKRMEGALRLEMNLLGAGALAGLPLDAALLRWQGGSHEICLS